MFALSPSALSAHDDVEGLAEGSTFDLDRCAAGGGAVRAAEARSASRLSCLPFPRAIKRSRDAGASAKH